MSWLTKLKNVFNPKCLDQDLQDEMRDHLERRAAEFRGRDRLSPQEAHRQAARLFGNATLWQEESRQVRMWAGLEQTFKDAQYAWRGLAKNRSFALTAILSLGLAIGANTAIYSIIEAAFTRPLPVPQADKLFVLKTSGDNDTFSYSLYEDLGRAAGNDARLILFDSPNRAEAQAFDVNGPYEHVIQQFVSPDFFSVLGVPPGQGQMFSSKDDHYPGPRNVVVLSYDYWQRRFGADPNVIGRKFVLDGRTYSILGVASKGFSGTAPGKFVDVWLPITCTDPAIFTNPDIRLFHLMGKLAPGVSRGKLQSLLQAPFHAHQLARISEGRDMPPAMQTELREMTLSVESGANGVSAFRRIFAHPLWILLGVSICMLLIACANVASLLLARATARSAEMALRVSLGAGRARLMRQLITESAMISIAAGFLGWLGARAIGPSLEAMVSTRENPIHLDLALNGDILFFCAAVCGVATLLFGVLPAWQATSAPPMFAMRHSSGQAGRLRLGRLFVSVQVAFAFCMVTGGAGFLFSLRNLAAVDTGFDAKGVTVLTVSNTSQRDRQFALMRELQTRVAELPNVQGAAAAWMPVFSNARRAQRVVLPGREPSRQGETFYRVAPGYFATLRTPLLQGRDFTFNDNDNEPVAAVVNRAFEKRYFGGESALGREFRRDDGVRHLIVGVAANSQFGSLRDGAEPIVYMPMKPPRGFTLYVRSGFDVASVMRIVDRECSALGAGIRVTDITTLDALVGASILRERLLASLGGAFAVLGLILASIGVFGLLNYSVTKRTKEIGVRTALGAHRLPIYTLVLKDLAGLLGAGLLAGLICSFVVMRVTQALLFGVAQADWRVVGVSAIVLLGAALIAGGMPARRAARIDPITALREE
jgi:predicted permease